MGGQDDCRITLLLLQRRGKLLGKALCHVLRFLPKHLLLFKLLPCRMPRMHSVMGSLVLARHTRHVFPANTPLVAFVSAWTRRFLQPYKGSTRALVPFLPQTQRQLLAETRYRVHTQTKPTQGHTVYSHHPTDFHEIIHPVLA